VTRLATTIHRGPQALGRVETVPALTLRRAAEQPAAVALIDGATGLTLTRGDLAGQSAALAAGLQARGIGAGDLVALAMPNLAWWPVAALGVWRAGAAIVPLSPLWTVPEAARVLEPVRPRLAIAFGPLSPLVRAAFDEAGIEAQVFSVGEGPAEATPIAELLSAPAGDPTAPPALELGDLAAVPFSSGTGGLPKGVRLTHGNLGAAAATTIATLGAGSPLDERAVILGCAPFFHALGLSLSLTGGLAAGARIVTMPRPQLDTFLELVAEHRVTHTAVPPMMVNALARDPRVDEHDLSSLATIATGGAAIPPHLISEVRARLGVVMAEGYGITEATCTVAGPLGRPNTPGATGWLVPGMEARIVDPETGEDAPDGEPGEILLRGPQIMSGYYGRAEETAATIDSDGWMRTGDLSAIRPDGQLEIRGRLKELIKVNGAAVAPAEVELVLRQHPAVRDAGVIGRPDPRRGEAPVAFVSINSEIEPLELVAFVAERVAGYKQLRELHVIDEVPRLPTGKLIRQALQALADSATPTPAR
jgi:acyl-CoA synthetase (AMP-forming)/AMP-acid ligase II